jgi:hypothetical protein
LVEAPDNEAIKQMSYFDQKF